VRGLSLFLFASFLITLSACNRTATTVAQANGQGFAGAIDLAKISNECKFKETETLIYAVDCQLMVQLDDGSKQTAESIREGIHIDWRAPYSILGEEVEVDSCQVSANQLSQSCVISVASQETTKVQVDSTVTVIETQKQAVKSAALLLLEWQQNYGTKATATCEQVPGDFDGDGDVDGRDFMQWQRGYAPVPRNCPQ